MDFVIGHDVELEIETAFNKIVNYDSEIENKTFYYSDILTLRNHIQLVTLTKNTKIVLV